MYRLAENLLGALSFRLGVNSGQSLLLLLSTLVADTLCHQVLRNLQKRIICKSMALVPVLD